MGLLSLLLLLPLVVPVLTASTDIPRSPSGSVSHAERVTREVMHFFRNDISTSLIWDPQLQLLSFSDEARHAGDAGDRLGQGVSGKCAAALARVARDLRSGERWAYRFLDSSARTPAGLLDGTVSSFGDYDECLDIQPPADVGTQQPDLLGKHCLLKFTSGSLFGEASAASQPAIAREVRDALHLFDTFTLNLGFCVPSACDAGDLRSLLSRQLASNSSSVLSLSSEQIFCDTHESNSFSVSKLSLPQLLSLAYLPPLSVWCTLQR